MDHLGWVSSSLCHGKVSDFTENNVRWEEVFFNYYLVSYKFIDAPDVYPDAVIKHETVATLNN